MHGNNTQLEMMYSEETNAKLRQCFIMPMRCQCVRQVTCNCSLGGVKKPLKGNIDTPFYYGQFNRITENK